MPYRILLRRDLSANWNYNDPVLMLGEPGFETDTGRLKIGDGQSQWSALGYVEGVTGPQGAQGAQGSQGPQGPSYGAFSTSNGSTGASGFASAPPSDAGKTAAGWISITIGGTGYYVPAWI